MFNIQCHNNISEQGLALFPNNRYKFTDNLTDAILLRSHKLHDMTINDKLKAIARAGAGTNNIPTELLTAYGIPVFNTPGANANAVKELVIACLFLASRNICQAWQETKHLQGEDIALQVESLKKQYSGNELPGKTLGVIGLGAIGVLVANAAKALGMNVIAYDPHITIENAWQLSSEIKQSHTLDEMLTKLDFLTVHVPFNQHTENLLNQQLISKLSNNCVVLNFSRGEIVDSKALLNSLNNNQIKSYITDFPSKELLESDKVIALPHLGASTLEAEENCAAMAVTTLREFLELGNIRHSVNFPNVNLGNIKNYRLTVTNKNIPNMVSQISNVLAKEDLNIIDMLNKSRNDVAYTIFDVNEPVKSKVLDSIQTIGGVLNCRII